MLSVNSFYQFCLYLLTIQTYTAQQLLVAVINYHVVRYPTRWSFLFIVDFSMDHISSPSKLQRNIVQLCTNHHVSSGKLVQCWQRERSGVIIMEMRRMPIKLPTTVVSNCVLRMVMKILKYLVCIWGNDSTDRGWYLC